MIFRTRLIRPIGLIGLAGLIGLLGASPIFAADFSSSNFKVRNPSIEELSGVSTSTSFRVQGGIPFISGSKATSTGFQIVPGEAGVGVNVVAPVVTAISGPDYGDVTLTWTAAQEVNSPSYEPGVSLTSGGPYTFASGQSGLSAIISNLSFSQQYYFVVRVKESGSVVATSLEVSAFPQAFHAASGGGGSSYAPPIYISPGPSPAMPPPGIIVTPVEQPPVGIIDKIVDVISGIFQPKPPPLVIGKVPLEDVVPKNSPLAFQAKWRLISREVLNEFVFRPLPEELRNLAGQVPQLGKLFAEVGINRFGDLEKLRKISLKMPGLTDVLRLPITAVSGGKVSGGKSLQIAELTPDLRAKFPKGVLFAKFAGGLIDISPNLHLTSGGESEQVIRTLVGKTLTLSVRPQYSASSVKGYIVFRNRVISGVQLEQPLADFFGVSTAHAAEAAQTALVLSEFEFTDPDQDGIYTAQVDAPVASGEYEVLTLISYQDVKLGDQLLKMVTVVDPEGYVYELAPGGKEVRVPGAIVTLSWLDPTTDTYKPWPAAEFQQVNPQITDQTGQYSFLVPQGWYQIKVEAPGYSVHEGKPFIVQDGRAVHENIELATSFQLLKSLDWKEIMLLIVFLLLVYNFYRDKLRERRERLLLGVGPPRREDVQGLP